MPRDLPSSPASIDGYPVLPAREALAALREGAPISRVAGERVVLESIKLGSATFRTDRGDTRLPAWIVTFRGATYRPDAVLAVAAPGIFRYREIPAAGTGLEQVRVTADGRTLTVRFTGAAAGSGPCQSEYVGGVDETTQAVGLAVLPVRKRSSSPAPSREGGADICTSEGHPRTVTVRLDKTSGRPRRDRRAVRRTARRRRTGCVS